MFRKQTTQSNIRLLKGVSLTKEVFSLGFDRYVNIMFWAKDSFPSHTDQRRGAEVNGLFGVKLVCLYNVDILGNSKKVVLMSDTWDVSLIYQLNIQSVCPIQHIRVFPYNTVRA